jgi:hypothetical protein
MRRVISQSQCKSSFAIFVDCKLRDAESAHNLVATKFVRCNGKLCIATLTSADYRKRNQLRRTFVKRLPEYKGRISAVL